MRHVFRKRSASAAQADEIPDDILAAIPDLESKIGANPFIPLAADPAAADEAEEDLAGPPAPWDAAPRADAAEDANAEPARGAPARRVPVDLPAPDVAALVADVRRQMETVFSRELAKVEDTFTAALHQMAGRIQEAQAENDGLRRENEGLQRVKAEYDRKAEALKELARSFDRP